MPMQFVDGPSGTVLVTTTETVVATINGINTRPGGSQVVLQGFIQLTTGTGVGALTVRLRRTNGVGLGVGIAAIIQCLASVNQAAYIQMDDNPGEVAAQTYVLTVVQNGATGNGSVQAASIRADY